MRNPWYTKLVGQCERLTFARALVQRRSSFAAEIEEIIVTARATEETVRSIPVATTAVNEERMDRFGLEGFVDLEAITPQLSIGRDGNGKNRSPENRQHQSIRGRLHFISAAKLFDHWGPLQRTREAPARS